MSELALELIAKAKREKARVLDLGKCGLRELPKELFELVWLEELYLCNRYWDYEPRKWVESGNQGMANHFDSLEGMETLVNLRLLYTGGDYKYGHWSISDIAVLQNLTQLHTLDLSYNKQIKDFSVLQNLTQLHTLYLSSNQINDIAVLQNLTQLHTLDLSSNKQIKDFSVLQNLTQLHTLYLSSNQSTILPYSKPNPTSYARPSLQSNQRYCRTPKPNPTSYALP